MSVNDKVKLLFVGAVISGALWAIFLPKQPESMIGSVFTTVALAYILLRTK